MNRSKNTIRKQMSGVRISVLRNVFIRLARKSLKKIKQKHYKVLRRLIHRIKLYLYILVYTLKLEVLRNSMFLLF